MALALVRYTFDKLSHGGILEVHMRRSYILGWVLALSGSGGAWGETPAAQVSQEGEKGSMPGISLAVAGAAMRALTADDFGQREKAVGQLEMALGQEVRTMLLELDDP